MALDHSTILQINATMIVGILIFLSFSSSLFQAVIPELVVEKQKKFLEGISLPPGLRTNLTPGFGPSERNLMGPLVVPGSVRLSLNETEELQKVQMESETDARLLQVTFTAATLVPFSASSLILLIYNVRMRQSEPIEKKFLRISVFIMLLGFGILVVFLLILTYLAFEVNLAISTP